MTWPFHQILIRIIIQWELHLLVVLFTSSILFILFWWFPSYCRLLFSFPFFYYFRVLLSFCFCRISYLFNFYFSDRLFLFLCPLAFGNLFVFLFFIILVLGVSMSVLSWTLPLLLYFFLDFLFRKRSPLLCLLPPFEISGKTRCETVCIDKEKKWNLGEEEEMKVESEITRNCGII